MVDNQEENFTKEEGALRDEINAFIESAYPGKGINEIIELKIKNKRGTYYRNVKKRPLKRKFIDMIKEDLGVDISIFNDTKNNTPSSGEVQKPAIATIPMETFLEMASDLRELNKDLQDRLKNEINYEREIKDLQLRIKDLEHKLKQG